jgi:hypothetical protein
MAQRERPRGARRAETWLRCRRCAVPYVVAGLSRRRSFRCHYCGDRLTVTALVPPIQRKSRRASPDLS